MKHYAQSSDVENSRFCNRRTLDSGINVGVRLLILGLFSSGYVLIKGGTFNNFFIFYLFQYCFLSFSHLADLRCLFLQNNKLDHIENISSLQNLTTLNLSHNYLSSLCSLACLPMLHTFIVSHNKLCTSKDLEELKA